MTRFKSFCSATEIKFLKPKLDVKTRWNSTFDMLDCYLRLYPALQLLWENCPDLFQYKIAKSTQPSLKILFNFLKYFKYLTNILSSEKDALIPKAIVGINNLLDKIEDIAEELDVKPVRTKEDELLISALMAGRDKIMKHYKKCNWICCISLILDPRFKYKGFESTRWGKDLKKESIRRFENLFKNNYFHGDQSEATAETKFDDLLEDPLDFSKVYVSEESTASWESEVHEYTQNRTAGYAENILLWWKKNEKTYPTLSRMARDILAITPTTVFIERFFAGGPLLMTQKRTRMTDETLKMFMCIYSWSKSLLKSEICDQ